MNSKSQLEWFYTFPNIVKASSGFPKIDWQTNSRAKANVVRLSRQQQQNEAAIARILYQELQQAQQGQLAVENWTAFLSRHSEKAANTVKNMILKSGTSSSQEISLVYEDILLMGFTLSAEPITILKNFNRDSVDNEIWYRVLHGYCRQRIRGKLIDYVRTKEGTKTFMRSNLGLAAKAGENKVVDSLTFTGIQYSQLEQYLFVWRCFKEVKNAYEINTKAFATEDFQRISDRIQELEAKHQYGIFSTRVLGDEVKAYLEQIGKAIRYFTDRWKTLSLDRAVFSEDSTTLSEKISDDTDKNDLNLVEQNSLTNELTAHTYDYLQQIDGAKWVIWLLKELVELKQTDIAIVIGSSQKTVSLNYRKAWQHFLTATISEFQPEDSPQLTSETITDLKEGLVEIVKSCFRSSLQDYLRSLPPTSDLPTNQQLLKFLQNHSNQKLTVNPDIQQKLDNFIETIDRLSDA